MANVTLDFDARIERFEREMQKLRAQNEGLIDQMGKLRKASEESSKAFDFGGLVKGAHALAAEYLSIRGVVALISNEWQTVIDRQSRALAATRTVAQAQHTALINLGATNVSERDSFIRQIGDISAKTGVSQKDLYGRSEAALSAKGNLPTSAALDAIYQSALIEPGDMEGGRTIAAAALDLRKGMAARGRDVDAQQAIGFLLQVGTYARVADPRKLAMNLAPTVSSGLAKGISERESAALWGALSGAMTDERGDDSRTAAIQAMMQIVDFMPTEDRKLYDEQGRLKRTVRGTNLVGLKSRIDALRRDKKQQDVFMQNANFEIKAKPFVREIISGEGAAAQMFDQFLSQQTGMDDASAAQAFGAQVKLTSGTAIQQTAALDRRLESTAESLQIANQPAAVIGALRQRYGIMMQDVGMGWAESKLKELAMEATPDKLAAFRQDIGRQQANLLRPIDFGAVTGDEFIMRGSVHREPTPVEKQQAEILGKLAEGIDELVKLQRESNTEQKKTGPAATAAQLNTHTEASR